MKCPECGAFVKSGIEKCPKCGHGLPKTEKAMKVETPAKGAAGATKKSTKGKAKIVDMRKTDQRFPSSPGPRPEEELVGPKRTIKPILAAVFLFIVAAQCFVQTAYYFFIVDEEYYRTILTQIGYTDDLESTLDLAMNMTMGCEIFFVIVGIFAIIAAILAIRRMKWGVCLAGTILAIFSIGMLLSGSILAIVAMILIIKSRKEFAGMNDENTLPEPEIRR